MLSASGNARHRFGHKCYIKTVRTKYIFYYVLYHIFVISSLQSLRIFPIYLQLLHNVIVVSGMSHLGLYSANFLMSHLRLKAILLQHHKRFFERCSYRSYRSLPILLFEALCRRKLFSVRFIIGCLYPKLKLSCTCKT